MHYENQWKPCMAALGSFTNALKDMLVGQLFKLFSQQHVLLLCCIHGVMSSDSNFLLPAFV